MEYSARFGLPLDISIVPHWKYSARFGLPLDTFDVPLASACLGCCLPSYFDKSSLKITNIPLALLASGYL